MAQFIGGSSGIILAMTVCFLLVNNGITLSPAFVLFAGSLFIFLLMVGLAIGMIIAGGE